MTQPHTGNWFSNMVPLDEPFEYQGLLFHTVEAFYQSCKVAKSDIETRRRISRLDPYQAKRAGKRVQLRADWEAIKLSVMKFGLRQKFAPGTSWHRRLMESGDAHLEETNSWHDNFYGNCVCGVRDQCKRQGANHLGKLLMKLRAEFTAQYRAECERVGHTYRLTDLSGTMRRCERCYEITPNESDMDAGELRYLTGDATLPAGDGRKILAHVVNDYGGWGRGFVKAISAHWSEPEAAYRRWFRIPPHTPGAPALGDVQFVEVAPDLTVANMIAQHGFYADEQGLPPIRYEALRQALREVRVQAQTQSGSPHESLSFRLYYGAGLWREAASLVEAGGGRDTADVPINHKRQTVVRGIREHDLETVAVLLAEYAKQPKMIEAAAEHLRASDGSGHGRLGEILMTFREMKISRESEGQLRFQITTPADSALDREEWTRLLDHLPARIHAAQQTELPDRQRREIRRTSLNLAWSDLQRGEQQPKLAHE